VQYSAHPSQQVASRRPEALVGEVVDELGGARRGFPRRLDVTQAVGGEGADRFAGGLEGDVAVVDGEGVAGPRGHLLPPRVEEAAVGELEQDLGALVRTPLVGELGAGLEQEGARLAVVSEQMVDERGERRHAGAKG